ncbi:MAG TPA: methyltransferase domain-containing protein [Burkholderiaceae bacterium]|nr:methyltransferase domain-containing protein [Burkholderiaceae bacterium]
MKQTPVHEQHNPDLLAYIPKDMKRLVEIGCSSGALAREYKKINANCHYTGIDIMPEYAQQAKRYCDKVMTLDIETVDVDFLQNALSSECWIFGDSLEHMRDPWALLSKIRQVIPQNGSIVACIPNAQHWTVQARLCSGAFRYEDVGLMDRTHLRWFTRITIMEMFAEAGFQVVDGMPRVFEEPERDKAMPLIREMAQLLGTDPDMAANDAMPLQYVVRAVPVGEMNPPRQWGGMGKLIGSALLNKLRRSG